MAGAAVPLNLLPELMQAGARRALAPLRIWMPAQLVLSPPAARAAWPIISSFIPMMPAPRRLEDADALLRGPLPLSTANSGCAGRRFRCSISTPPSQAWQEALHGFAWLPSLSVAGGEAARGSPPI